MIIKSFELKKIANFEYKLFLLYGQNEGLKNEIIKKHFIEKFKSDIFRYDEKEILDNRSNFFDGIFSKSFFEEKKIFIISRVTEKFNDIIEQIIEKEVKDITIILNSTILDKKSKLRKLFEKNKDVICIPFYADNYQSLSFILINFFKKNKIPVSQEILNILVDRANGDRQSLKNEMNKIESFKVYFVFSTNKHDA